MRGTFKRIEVERRGGVQARRRAGSLKLLQDLHFREKLSDPSPLRFFVTYLTNVTTNKPLSMDCCVYEAERLEFALNESRAS